MEQLGSGFRASPLLVPAVVRWHVVSVPIQALVGLFLVALLFGVGLMSGRF
jgi:hypothetical protein